MREKGDVVIAAVGEGSLLERDIVINNDGVGDAKSKNVDSIDAISIKIFI